MKPSPKSSPICEEMTSQCEQRMPMHACAADEIDRFDIVIEQLDNLLCEINGEPYSGKEAKDVIKTSISLSEFLRDASDAIQAKRIEIQKRIELLRETLF